VSKLLGAFWGEFQEVLTSLVTFCFFILAFYSSFFFFVIVVCFVFVVLGFELRASCLLDSCFTLATRPALILAF
jgi:hypothetical protein